MYLLMTKVIDLNGEWDWKILGGETQKRIVPSCYACVGDAYYSRSFLLDSIKNKCVIMHFEGVSYTGEVSVNEHKIGEMLPYVYYDFDITDSIIDGNNTVSVLIKDFNAGFGPTGGWEDYGGISRDVWVEIRDVVFIEDVHWNTILKNNYTCADAVVNVQTCNKSDLENDIEITARLTYKNEIVAVASVKTNDNKAQLLFYIDDINTWNVNNPELYTLYVEVKCGNITDKKEIQVGFSKLEARGQHLYLNGEKIFLKGVARHEMWKGQGFTFTKEQVEQDLTLIKEMGGNFIRLVHYPHSRHTIEFAAEIGLLITEEPGLWWSDLGNEYIINCSLEILHRTIIRDRSSPAIGAWLFFNECKLDNAALYLEKGAKLCRELDPGRLISGASCMDNEITKKIFDETGMDFYTAHPYCFEEDKHNEAADILRGKPLVFTEWGGWLIHENPNLIALHKSRLLKLAHADENEPSLAGMCWWQWQDVMQYSRGLPGCIQGTLGDGLVDGDRNKKMMYTVMADIFNEIDNKPSPYFEIKEFGDFIYDNIQDIKVLDLSNLYGEQNDNLWQQTLTDEKRWWRTPRRPWEKLNQGIYIHKPIKGLSGLPCDIPAGYPLILRNERSEICISVERRVKELLIFGGVSYYDGYPLRGEYNKETANIVLEYSDGTISSIPLRHGVETASASLIGISSRIDAQAVNAPRIAEITVDPDWEIYAVNLLRIDVDFEKTLKSVKIKSINNEFEQVIYSVAVV